MVPKDSKRGFLENLFAVRTRQPFGKYPKDEDPRLDEPSAALRAAVRRYRLGLPGHGASPRRTALEGEGGTAALSYEAVAVHRRSYVRSGLGGSDALMLTQFTITEADADLPDLLGGCLVGSGVLTSMLGGLELIWHADLMRSMEDQAAIWSVSRIAEIEGDHIVEHIVIPARGTDGQLTLKGWYCRSGGTLRRNPLWSEVVRTTRMLRSRRISPGLPAPATGSATLT
jgi:hypothetical protein